MNNTIKSIPPQERPYEKCISFGEASLSDAELLAVIIKTGTRNYSCLDLARLILTRSCSNEGLLVLHSMTAEELMDIPGIGPVKAIQLKCIGELCRRMSSLSKPTSTTYSSPDDIAHSYMERMRHFEEEHVILLLLDCKCRLIKDITLSIGNVNTSIVSPREVFINALRYKAVNIVLIHNHPSGDPTPSSEDIEVTRNLIETGEMIGIPLIDHLIIGDNKFVSFKQLGFE